MRLRGLAPLLLHAVAFAVAGYALAQIVRGGSVANFVIWFAGTAVLHDVLLLPVYSLVDRLTPISVPRRRRSAINYIRAPALISGVLLLVYFPAIFGLSAHNYLLATGHHLHGYARNWLLITAALFATSGLVWAARRPWTRPPTQTRPRTRPGTANAD